MKIRGKKRSGTAFFFDAIIKLLKTSEKNVLCSTHKNTRTAQEHSHRKNPPRATTPQEQRNNFPRIKAQLRNNNTRTFLCYFSCAHTYDWYWEPFSLLMFQEEHEDICRKNTRTVLCWVLVLFSLCPYIWLILETVLFVDVLAKFLKTLTLYLLKYTQ